MSSETENEVVDKKKTFKIGKFYAPGEHKFLRQVMKEKGFEEVDRESEDWQFWYVMRVKPDQWSQVIPTQKVNYIPGVTHLCRKDFLHRYLLEMGRAKGAAAIDFWPTGFSLPSELDALRAWWAADGNASKWVILKPPRASNGRRIRLLTSASELDDLDGAWMTEWHPLAQEYLGDPMLLHGYKFTLRIYVCVTSVDPLRVFVYPNGLVRLCSRRYSATARARGAAVPGKGQKAAPEDLDFVYTHLDSFELNGRNAEEFARDVEEKFDGLRHDGLRVTVKDLFRYLDARGLGPCPSSELWARIHSTVARSMFCVERKLTGWVKKHVPHRYNVYDLFGYDIFFEADGRSRLLEINHTPEMTPHTALENKVKYKMMRDLIGIADVGADDRARVVADVARKLPLLRGRQAAELRLQPGDAFYEEEQLLRSLDNHDLYVLVDTEYERLRQGKWVRAFPVPEADELYPGLYEKNRNEKLILFEKYGLHTDILFSALQN